MSPSPQPGAASASPTEPDLSEAPDSAGKFSISEDWLAVIVGLVLLAGALTGVIPAGLVP